MKRSGYTLIEVLAAMLVIAAAMFAWMIVADRFGALMGIRAALFAGSISIMAVISFYRWMSHRDECSLNEAREKYLNIYRVVASLDPEIIILPDGAEIRVGDYGWEAGPARDDDLIYLQGLTRDWTVVWHAGFHSDEIEKVCEKPCCYFPKPFQFLGILES
jgi:prepilin-type N-terminal cleavage/methylation domain-containing protein